MIIEHRGRLDRVPEEPREEEIIGDFVISPMPAFERRIPGNHPEVNFYGARVRVVRTD